MQDNGFARIWLGFLIIAVILMAGCRSTATDRMRVLEAQKADSERRNDQLKHQLAELRAQQIEAESARDSANARAEALNAQLEMQRRPTGRPAAQPVVVDRAALEEELRGTGVQLTGDGHGGARIVLASDVTFRPGRADLNRDAAGVLAKIAQALRSTEGVQAVRVEGHTDSDPIVTSGWSSNDALSLARAQIVRKYLVTQGVAEDFMTVEGHGSNQPVAPNTTDAGKARNRRVEIVLLARN